MMTINGDTATSPGGSPTHSHSTNNVNIKTENTEEYMRQEKAVEWDNTPASTSHQESCAAPAFDEILRRNIHKSNTAPLDIKFNNLTPAYTGGASNIDVSYKDVGGHREIILPKPSSTSPPHQTINSKLLTHNNQHIPILPKLSSPPQQTHFIPLSGLTGSISPNSNSQISVPELMHGNTLTVNMGGGKRVPAKALLLVTLDDSVQQPQSSTNLTGSSIRYNPYYKQKSKHSTCLQTQVTSISPTTIKPCTCGAVEGTRSPRPDHAYSVMDIPSRVKPTVLDSETQSWNNKFTTISAPEPVTPLVIDVSSQSSNSKDLLMDVQVVQPDMKIANTLQPIKMEDVQPTKTGLMESCSDSEHSSYGSDESSSDGSGQKPVFSFYNSGKQITCGNLPTPYKPRGDKGRTVEEKRSIKKEQNKTAAQRYRVKKRQQQIEYTTEKESLLKRREELEKDAQVLELEVTFLKNLLIETRINNMKSKTEA